MKLACLILATLAFVGLCGGNFTGLTYPIGAYQAHAPLMLESTSRRSHVVELNAATVGLEQPSRAICVTDFGILAQGMKAINLGLSRFASGEIVAVYSRNFHLNLHVALVWDGSQRQGNNRINWLPCQVGAA